jgi:hypothetical protein
LRQHENSYVGEAVTDEIAKTARLMKMTETIVAEFSRQASSEVLADLGLPL